MRAYHALMLLLLAACSQPGFIPSDTVAPPPPLLPIDEVLAPSSATLTAEAAAALAARGAALKSKAGS